MGPDASSADRSSKIMARLLRMGISINALDVLIAVAHGAKTVVSKDTDFLEILKVTDLEVSTY